MALDRIKGEEGVVTGAILTELSDLDQSEELPVGDQLVRRKLKFRGHVLSVEVRMEKGPKKTKGKGRGEGGGRNRVHFGTDDARRFQESVWSCLLLHNMYIIYNQRIRLQRILALRSVD